MDPLDNDIALFERMRGEMERDHYNEWVVIHEAKVVGFFPSFDRAGEEAGRQFGRGPYLIRQVGAAPMTLPASVIFRPISDGTQLRLPRQ